jgi:Leucine-rich repeat (LRR) protein
LSLFIAWLDLSNTQISAKTLQWVAKMPALKELNLRQTPIQAQDLVLLAQHKSIERLNLSGVPLDDTVVDLLMNMPNLKRVYLSGSQVSKTGIRQLSAPRIEVVTEAKPSEVISTDPNEATQP